MAREVTKKLVGLIIDFEASGDITNYQEAYRCPAGILTIGAGTTRYPDGSSVKEGDSCTEEMALQYLFHDLNMIASQVEKLIKVKLNDNQFDALVSFAYNLGATNLASSRLLKKVNSNPNDTSIDLEFKKWVYAKGRKLKGLVIRRSAESQLYFGQDESI